LTRAVVSPTRKPAATIVADTVQVKIAENMTQLLGKRRTTECTAAVWKSQITSVEKDSQARDDKQEMTVVIDDWNAPQSK
jgi:hypothetical protein